MTFIERLRELTLGLLPGRSARTSKQESLTSSAAAEPASRVNPWTQDLERLACYTREEPADYKHSESGEVKIQMLMEQARLEKAKEALRQQMQEAKEAKAARPDTEAQPGEKRKPRTTDATIVDGKAWWGQAVATWDPEDAKNLGPQGEIKHPRQHKWFNQ